ncbi:MAG: radical SAM protein [Planctomycetota bacterium]
MKEAEKKESPEYLRISLSSAMWLDLKNGLFWRGAKSPCVNLLVTYDEGCYANCSYCGLARKRPGKWAKKSFIHVGWNKYLTTELIKRVAEREKIVKRACISMITNKRCVGDTIEILSEFRKSSSVKLSVLLSPTVITKSDIEAMKNAGADKVGIAVDAATPKLFKKFRGEEVSGPHVWEVYWERVEEAVSVFGKGNVGVHLIVGIGETEHEMCAILQKVHDVGAETHLFSFLAEPESAMAEVPQPQLGHYRRMQLARYIIDNNISSLSKFEFSQEGRLENFGIPQDKLDEVINSCTPFETSGCTGADGAVACNRPFANTIIPEVRNFPFKPNEEDIEKIRADLKTK